MLFGPVSGAVNHAVIAKRLSDHGVHIDNVAEMVKGIDLKIIKVTKEGESEDQGQTFVTGLILAMLLYVSLIIYGVITMRSVLEEKTTRIVEVLISALRPFQLLLGKILGVARCRVHAIPHLDQLGTAAHHLRRRHRRVRQAWRVISQRPCSVVAAHLPGRLFCVGLFSLCLPLRCGGRRQF